MHTYQKSVSGHNSLLSNLIGMILHLFVVHDTEVVVVGGGGYCPVRTCLVYIEGFVAIIFLY